MTFSRLGHSRTTSRPQTHLVQMYGRKVPSRSQL